MNLRAFEALTASEALLQRFEQALIVLLGDLHADGCSSGSVQLCAAIQVQTGSVDASQGPFSAVYERVATVTARWQQLRASLNSTVFISGTSCSQRLVPAHAAAAAPTATSVAALTASESSTD
jgi:hypothetical protein